MTKENAGGSGGRKVVVALSEKKKSENPPNVSFKIRGKKTQHNTEGGRGLHEWKRGVHDVGSASDWGEKKVTQLDLTGKEERSGKKKTGKGDWKRIKSRGAGSDRRTVRSSTSSEGGGLKVKKGEISSSGRGRKK